MQFLLHETEDGIGRPSVRVEVDCRQMPDGPSPVARKKGSNDVA